MATSSYGSSTASSGVVRILKDRNSSIEGRNIVVVGTLFGQRSHNSTTLVHLLRDRRPGSLRIMTLLDKVERREVDIPVDWVASPSQ